MVEGVFGIFVLRRRSVRDVKYGDVGDRVDVYCCCVDVCVGGCGWDVFCVGVGVYGDVDEDFFGSCGGDVVGVG